MDVRTGHKKTWAPKNWCFWTLVLEKTLESPLNCKEIQPVNPKGNHCWILIGRNDAEIPIFWPPNAKNWLIGKDPDAGKDWRQKEKGMTEDKMVGWHHQLDGHEFEQALGVGDGLGSLASIGMLRVRHDWASELNWTELIADSCCCTAETNITLQNNFPPIKKKFTLLLAVGLTFLGRNN